MIDDPLPGHLADLEIVAADPAGVVGFDDVALEAERGDARLHGLAHDLGQGVTLQQGDDEEVGFLTDGGLDLGDLLGGIGLAVVDDELDAGFLGEEFGQAPVLGPRDQARRCWHRLKMTSRAGAAAGADPDAGPPAGAPEPPEPSAAGEPAEGKGEDERQAEAAAGRGGGGAHGMQGDDVGMRGA